MKSGRKTGVAADREVPTLRLSRCSTRSAGRELVEHGTVVETVEIMAADVFGNAVYLIRRCQYRCSSAARR